MRDERFINIEKDILRSVGRVLSSTDMTELKNTIFAAMDQVDTFTTNTARKVEQAAEKMEYRAQRSYQHSGYEHYSNKTSYTPPKTESYHHNYPPTYRNYPVKGSTGAGLWLSFSIVGIVLSALAIPTTAIFSIISGGGFSSMLVPTACLAASILSTVFAGKNISRIGRYKKYLKTLGGHPMYSCKELAENTKLPLNTVSKDMPKLLKAVSFPFAKMDDEKTCLILDKDTYQQYLDLKENRRRIEAEEAEKKARLANDPNAAAVEEMKQQGSEYLRQIRKANDNLPEEAISNKLDSLESICGKIFIYVEKNPNKLPQIRKMMCYYLPMTLKLVETYEQLDKHPSSQSVEESKAEIHSALDNILLAFQNLFERLLENDLMNLSADISVLETMLAQEGLTGPNNNINLK